MRGIASSRASLSPPPASARARAIAAHVRSAVSSINAISSPAHRRGVAWCTLSKAAGADFVKTSTGFSSARANAAGGRLMRDSLPDHVAVKASGGIRTAADALRMVESGASRIGTSGSAGIIESLSEV